MKRKDWQIYLGQIPYNETGPFWVSFESDPGLKKTRADIYGKCLPCIQSLYGQLKAGRTEIELGTAYHCWKITAVLDSIEQCLSLLTQFKSRFAFGHVYGKLGSGRSDSKTRVVVFHTDDKAERNRIRKALESCLKEMDLDGEVLISRGCAALYEKILGHWGEWLPTTPIRFPERVKAHLEFIKKTLFRSAM